MKKIIKYILISYFIIVLLKILLSSLILTPTVYSDEYSYMKLARSFFFDLDFSIHGVKIYVYPPLYPIILSISYIFKDMTLVYFFMKVINALISSLVIIPAFLLSREFLNEKRSLIASLLISILPSNFSFSPYIMSENLFYPLSLFAIYFMYKSFINKNYTYNILTGILLALSYLTRIISVSLIATFFICCFILFLIKKNDRILIIKKSFITLFFFLVFISPWLIKNFYFYGFNLKLFLGPSPYTKEALSIVTNFKLINYIIKFLIYTSYLIIASLIIFPVKSINLINKKNLIFSILFIVSLITTLIIVANHGRIVIFFDWFTGRYIGRYIDFLLPLIFIGGFIGAEKNKKVNKLVMFVFCFLLALGSLLTLHSLFPINNLSLTWVGVLKYIFELLIYNKFDYSIKLFTGSLIFFALFFVSLFFLILFMERKFSLKKIIPYLFIFLILLNLLNYTFIYHDSRVNWYDDSQMQLGLWLNKYDSNKISNILFDENSCGQLTKEERFSICGGVNNIKTIIGYWLNDNITIGNVSNFDDYDYVISNNSEIDLNLIKEDKNIYVYKVKN